MRLFALFALVCVIVTIIVIALIRNEEKRYAERVFPSVYINGFAVGGMKISEVTTIFNQRNKQLSQSSIQVLYEHSPIATFSAKQIRLAYDSNGTAERAYLIGRSARLTSRVYQQILSLTHLRKFDFAVSPQYDVRLVKEKLTLFEEKYNHDAKNALFKFENGRAAKFRPETNGRILESQRFLTDFDNTIKSYNKDTGSKKVILISRVIKPEITLAQANSFGIEELIAEGKSDYTHSIPGRVHNVILAASKFNGVLIPKGETFSFNEVIGDISASTGYMPAYIIKGGRSVLGDGGGVCQVSTTLFRTALNAGLPITERHAHAYRVQYYENDRGPGFDATVFSPSVDFKFKNNTSASILVQTEVNKENNILTFRFYGKRDGRKVEISDAKVYDVQPPPPALYQDDPLLKKGVVSQVDFPAWGAKANFTYKVTMPDKTLAEQSFFSSYRPWTAIYLVGQAD